jgi:hypothetical protein
MKKRWSTDEGTEPPAAFAILLAAIGELNFGLCTDGSDRRR